MSFDSVISKQIFKPVVNIYQSYTTSKKISTYKKRCMMFNITPSLHCLSVFRRAHFSTKKKVFYITMLLKNSQFNVFDRKKYIKTLSIVTYRITYI